MTFDYRHRSVRDLAWALYSPPLITELPDSGASLWTPEAKAAERNWLAALDADPARLTDFLGHASQGRLGRYFEALLAFYWQERPGQELLAHDLPVRRGKRTLGAFDFLCRADEQLWHLEAAVKFYLGLPDGEPSQSTPWAQWLGPGARDRLDLKLTHLRDHQLRLGDCPEGRAALAARGGEGAHWQPRLRLAGYLFYPAHAPMAPPQQSHPAQGRGVWWYRRDFLRRTRPEGARWRVLERSEWLAPARLEAPEAPLTGAQLRAQLDDQADFERPVMICRLALGGGVWREVERGFVVPDQWPNTG